MLGIAAVALILAIEAHGYAAPYFGGAADGALKLLYLPLFVWLLLEGLKLRAA